MSSLTSNTLGKGPGMKAGWSRPLSPPIERRCTEPVKPEHVMMQRSLCWTLPLSNYSWYLWFNVNKPSLWSQTQSCFPITQSSDFPLGSCSVNHLVWCLKIPSLHTARYPLSHFIPLFFLYHYFPLQ